MVVGIKDGAKLVSLVSGLCLLITSVIMLMFYIKHYIDTHKKELGILKALGYSNLKIAKNFWVFGIAVFFGTSVGYCGAHLIMPWFYTFQNEDKILPEISIHFHPLLLFYLVVVPTLVFALLAILYACLKVRRNVTELLKESLQSQSKAKKRRDKKEQDRPFLESLKKNTLKERKTLVFFIVFSSFCFSSMTQMSFSMKDLSSVMMGMMIMIIGLVLACTTMFLAITTVVNSNTKVIAMMRVFGYSNTQCRHALLDGYRPMGYIGFVIGTIYQYVLLRFTVSVVFKDFADIPAYKFDFPLMLLSLAFFIVIYEAVMYCYSAKIKKISVKEIMLES